jgi:hypothetical protein
MAIADAEGFNVHRRQYRSIRFGEDVEVRQITPSVISHSVNLLENDVLRAMDAFHVACAMEWGADLFVTSDRRQLTAAQKAGLRTEYLGRPGA